MRFLIDTDSQLGTAQFASQPSDYIDVRILSAGVAESHTVPSSAKFVVFNGTADFFAKFGAAASIPVADVTDGTASELNPTQRQIPNGVATIGLISPSGCTVSLAFFK